MKSQKKTILYIHHGKGIGGAPLSLLYMVQALDTTRFRPIVLFLHDSDALTMYKEFGIETIGPVNRMDFPHTKIWWLRWYHVPMMLKAIKDTLITALFTAPHMLKKIAPDAVHLNTSSLIAWGYAAHRLKIPVIWHIREPLAQGYFGLRRWLVRTAVARYATRILAICKNDALPWKQLSKTEVIYNAVPTQKFNPDVSPQSFLERYNLDPASPKILFLGGLSREKGTHVIDAVFTSLIQRLPTAQLLIAGNSLHFTQKHNVHLLGIIHNVPEAMAACNVIVFPATVGHFARPVIEAGCMKRPVVASRLAPLDELVVHNKTGFLVDPKDTNAWVNALYRLLTDRMLQKTMGEEAYTLCCKKFGIETQKALMEKTYEHTIS